MLSLKNLKRIVGENIFNLTVSEDPNSSGNDGIIIYKYT